LFIVLFLGLFLVIGSIVVDWTFDEAVPELTKIGMVDNTNVSEYTGYALNPVDNVVQSFTWLSGIIYIFALLGCLGLSFTIRFTGNKWLLGFFIACMFLLIVASIFISNIYEDFYNDDGDVGDRLREHEMLSYLILYSPVIMSIIGFICGIIMFTGEGEEQYGL
jgi:hypothetical protein